MDDLSKYLKFLGDTDDLLNAIKNKLETMQKKFNENFMHSDEIKKTETEFLQTAFFTDKKDFPQEIIAAFEKKFPQQKKKYEENLKELKNKQDKLLKTITEYEQKRVSQQKSATKKNVRLDKEEEKLKKEIEKLQDEIDNYNDTIDELNSGIGFIVNFFKMKKIQDNKEKILIKRDELIEDLEEVRTRWSDFEKTFDEDDTNRQNLWQDDRTELAILNEKIERIINNKEELINKATFHEVLLELSGKENYLLSKEFSKYQGKCDRCKSQNNERYFFCNYCGNRFKKDKPDIKGSLLEAAELYELHSRLKQGIQKTVSLIALFKGFGKGINTFTESIQKVKKSQDQYASLPQLKIALPSVTLEFAEKLKELEKVIDENREALHPARFAEKTADFTEKHFTDKKIETFFTAMGDALNEETKKQWP